MLSTNTSTFEEEKAHSRIIELHCGMTQLLFSPFLRLFLSVLRNYYLIT